MSASAKQGGHNYSVTTIRVKALNRMQSTDAMATVPHLFLPTDN